jgi:prolyl-tRNA editing enzyme YbaK/EbsC (Cys-tRNA(Pro) deacylase)
MDTNAKLQRLGEFLQSQHADYDILIDELNLSQASTGAVQYGIPLSQAAPTLILKLSDQYIAVIIRGDTRISFKKLKQVLQIKEASMADPQIVEQVTGSKIGQVSLINPGLTTIIDTHVLENTYCYGGCGVANATLKINTHDLVRIINARVLDFAEPR